MDFAVDEDQATLHEVLRSFLEDQVPDSGGFSFVELGLVLEQMPLRLEPATSSQVVLSDSDLHHQLLADRIGA